MQRIHSILILLFLPFLAFGQGKVTRHTQQSTQYKEPSKDPIKGILNGHEWVDFGLPSGTLWATCNVGTDRFDYYGDYFVWGNLQKINNDNVSWSKRPQYYSQSSSFSGLAQYDPAKALWGKTWRTPTKEEFQELIDNCTFTWTDEYDGGVWVVSKNNGQKIYLPACGGCSGTQGYDYVGSVGIYWASTASSTETTYKDVSDYAYCFQFTKEQQSNQLTPSIRTNPRQACLNVRPVISKK